MTPRFIGITLVLTVLLLGAAACGITSPQTSQPIIIPTSRQSFASVELVKPTQTPLPAQPTLDSSSTANPMPTPESVAQAVIVDSQTVPVNYSGGKKILVDISDQYMYVYDGEKLVFSFISSTGMNNATRTGSFSVLDKIPNAYGATWDLWMPNWLGIYYAGSLENGIHALPILSNGATLWSGFLGRPISYGCIVLDTSDAQVLYDWAEVGVPVEIQW